MPYFQIFTNFLETMLAIFLVLDYFNYFVSDAVLHNNKLLIKHFLLIQALIIIKLYTSVNRVWFQKPTQNGINVIKAPCHFLLLMTKCSLL